MADIVSHDLRALFCGINLGLYLGCTGRHFARPGNRFWPAIHLTGFMPQVLKPAEERELLTWGCGITNLVNRAAATAAEVGVDEMAAGV